MLAAVIGNRDFYGGLAFPVIGCCLTVGFTSTRRNRGRSLEKHMAEHPILGDAHARYSAAGKARAAQSVAKGTSGRTRFQCWVTSIALPASLAFAGLRGCTRIVIRRWRKIAAPLVDRKGINRSRAGASALTHCSSEAHQPLSLARHHAYRVVIPTSKNRAVGRLVNLEFDIIGQYVGAKWCRWRRAANSLRTQSRCGPQGMVRHRDSLGNVHVARG
jgi:hypothetical protein